MPVLKVITSGTTPGKPCPKKQRDQRSDFINFVPSASFAHGYWGGVPGKGGGRAVYLLGLLRVSYIGIGL